MDVSLFLRFVILTRCCREGDDQFKAAAEGEFQQLCVLLARNNVDDVDDYGWTALHNAAWYGNVECTNYCVDMRANVNAHDNDGWTPVHCASREGNVDVLCVLLNAGATVDTPSNAGFTPLYYAINDNRDDVAKLLIDRGAKVFNIRLDKFLLTIPNWINMFILSQSQCRNVAIVLIGIHQFHRSNVTGNNDINVMRLVSKHIWSTHMDNTWNCKK
jgi:ankyrin repeat protein